MADGEETVAQAAARKKAEAKAAEAAEAKVSGEAEPETDVIEPKQTTYLAWWKHGDDWHLMPDRITVPSGRSDLAKDQLLAKVAGMDPGAEKITIAVVSERSWIEQTFEKEPPAPPAFKPAS